MIRALITGITGQDGSYLAELLLSKGYAVHGIVRRANRPERSWIGHLCRDSTILGKHLFLHYVDLDDPSAVRRVLLKTSPEELYHLAGPSHVGSSFEMPEATCQATGMLTLRLLEMARDMTAPPKFVYASSCEIFGEPTQVPQTEDTPIAPVTPYGCGKAFATQMVRVYRKAHRLFACNAILFNHESPRRGEDFVTRKITRAAAAIRLGLQSDLTLGDIKAERDWGHARDYVLGLWQALQYETPEDFVFATGRPHSVEDVVKQAFAAVQLDWTQFVRHDPGLLRPAEPRRLMGNAAKAKLLLGWEPQTTFEDLITEMTKAELAALTRPS